MSRYFNLWQIIFIDQMWGQASGTMHKLDIRLARACNIYFTMHLKADKR